MTHKTLSQSANLIAKLVHENQSYRNVAYELTVSEYALLISYKCSHEIVRAWAKGASRISAQAALCVHYRFGTPLCQLRPDIWSAQWFPETYSAPKHGDLNGN